MENMDKVEIRCADCGDLIATVERNAYEAILGENEPKEFRLFGQPIILWHDEKFYCASCKGDHFSHCYHCNKLICLDEDDYEEVDNYGDFCEDCKNDFLSWCDHCERYVYEDTLTMVYTNDYGREEHWCESCVDEDAWRCHYCDDWYSDDCEAHRTVDGDYICTNCRDDHYRECEDCGNYVYEGDCFYDEDDEDCDYPRCRRCYNEYTNTRSGCHIYGYHHYPNHWEFRSDVGNGLLSRTKHLHLGIEKEIDRGGESAAKAELITTALGFPASQSDEFKCSRDGSLNSGFEIISMPATLEYHLKKYNWEAGMAEAIKQGYQSHDAGTCGLHFHFDRKYFIDSMTKPEEAFVIITTNNMDWLKQFSRRNNYRYCAFIESSKFSVDDFKNKDLSKMIFTQQRLDNLVGCYKGHSTALNFNNHGTIEVRFIRGTLKYSTFVASLQLMEMIGYAVKHFRKEQLVNVNPKWFKNYATRKGYNEFLSYLNERGIITA